MSSERLHDSIPSIATSSYLKVALPMLPLAVRAVEDAAESLATGLAREAEDKAFARGLAEGERRALATACGALTRAAERLEAAASAACDEVASDAAQLGIEIARSLLRSEIRAGRYDLERIVRETLHASGAGRGACVVHLHPTDVARLSNTAFRSGTTIEADPEVRPGDVHVTTQRGVLVRDVDQALVSIAEKIASDLA